MGILTEPHKYDMALISHLFELQRYSFAENLVLQIAECAKMQTYSEKTEKNQKRLSNQVRVQWNQLVPHFCKIENLQVCCRSRNPKYSPDPSAVQLGNQSSWNAVWRQRFYEVVRWVPDQQVLAGPMAVRYQDRIDEWDCLWSEERSNQPHSIQWGMRRCWCRVIGQTNWK